MSTNDLNDFEGKEMQSKIYIGMTLKEVSDALGGPPDNTNSGSWILGGKGKVAGISTSPYGPAELRSRLFFTKYCVWRCPEGAYYLKFVHDVLESVQGAPKGAVAERTESSEKSLPARFVLVFTDGGSESPGDVLDAMIRDGKLRLHPDALVYGHVDADMAIDLPLQSVMTHSITRAIAAMCKAGRAKGFLDLDTCSAKRFRKARGPGSAGVLVTITGARNDPDSSRYLKAESASRRDICGNCRITEEERLRQWNAPVPRGKVKIGESRGAFMYCERCRSGICGRCSIDLGLTAGCPLCRSELVYMDGERQ